MKYENFKRDITMDAWEEYCDGKISVYELLEAYPTDIKKENIDNAIDEFFIQDIIRDMKELE